MKPDRQVQDNPYLTVVPLDRVRADALYGVRLARLAWRIRDPESAALAMGRIVEPGHEHELVRLPRPTTPGEKPVRRKAREKSRAGHARAKKLKGKKSTRAKKPSKRKRGSKARRM